MGATDVVLWPVDQIRGWFENAGEVVSSLSPDDFIPPALADTLAWVWEQFLYSLGFGTIEEQLAASFALGVAAVFSSIVTLGATLVLVVFFAMMFGLGLLRLWPVFDDYIWIHGA